MKQQSTKEQEKADKPESILTTTSKWKNSPFTLVNRNEKCAIVIGNILLKEFETKKDAIKFLKQVPDWNFVLIASAVFTKETIKLNENEQ